MNYKGYWIECEDDQTWSIYESYAKVEGDFETLEEAQERVDEVTQ